jgi:excisionase family DNA binding protein
MLLSVNQAARRLGVSPVTVRRWTATGMLRCTRTAGGHRRIDERDLDDLARSLGAGSQVAVQAAREREVEVLVDTSIALAGRLDLGELLHEIAMRMTSLLDCHFCAISDYDSVAGGVVTLAEYDDAGRRLPDHSPYQLGDFPLTRRVLQDQVTVVVNVDDPDADEAEVAELRREGDRSLLMVPLVVQGDSIGLLEVVDQQRARRYSRQELRLARAVAGQAAVALKNARLFAERRRSDEDVDRLRHGLSALNHRVLETTAAATRTEVLSTAAEAACEALGAIACVAAAGGESAGASGAVTLAAGPDGATGSASAGLLVGADSGGGVTLTATLPSPPAAGQAELLELVAAIAAAALARIGAA